MAVGSRCNILSLIAATALTLLPLASSADEVYRYEDAKGVIHYSNKPFEDAAQPADLPRITRGRLGLQAKIPDTCNQHGDINCQAGADVDGSVICTDGYLDAVTRYRLHCNSPKLELADIGEPGSNGDFSILVRNAKSVAAEKPELILRLNQNSAGIILKGPDTIEPFEVGEFFYKSSEYGRISRKLKPSQITMTCSNCEN